MLSLSLCFFNAPSKSIQHACHLCNAPQDCQHHTSTFETASWIQELHATYIGSPLFDIHRLNKGRLIFTYMQQTKSSFQIFTYHMRHIHIYYTSEDHKLSSNLCDIRILSVICSLPWTILVFDVHMLCAATIMSNAHIYATCSFNYLTRHVHIIRGAFIKY